MSTRRRSKAWSARTASAATPFSAVVTRWASLLKISSSSRATIESSSTTRIDFTGSMPIRLAGGHRGCIRVPAARWPSPDDAAPPRSPIVSVDRLDSSQSSLSRSVIRRFHGVRPLETPMTLFLPDSVASTVKPEDPAVRELILDVRTRVIACCAPSHPDRAVLVDVPRRRSRSAWFPHERRYHSRQRARVEPFTDPLCDSLLIHAAFPPYPVGVCR